MESQSFFSKLPSAESFAENARTGRIYINALTDTIGAGVQLYGACQTAQNVLLSNPGRVERECLQRRYDDVIKRRMGVEEKNQKSAAERQEKSDKLDEEHRKMILKVDNDSNKALDEIRKASEEKREEHQKDVVETEKHRSEQVALENKEFQLKIKKLEIEQRKLEKSIAEKHLGDLEKKLEEEKVIREEFEEKRKTIDKDHDRILEEIQKQLIENQARCRADEKKFHEQLLEQMEKEEETKKQIHQDKIARMKNETAKILEEAEKSSKLLIDYQVNEGNRKFLQITKASLLEPMMALCSATDALKNDIDFLSSMGEEKFDKEAVEEYLKPTTEQFDKCFAGLEQEVRRFSNYLIISSDGNQDLRSVAHNLQNGANKALVEAPQISRLLNVCTAQSLGYLKGRIESLETFLDSRLESVNASKMFLALPQVGSDQTTNFGAVARDQ